MSKSAVLFVNLHKKNAADVAAQIKAELEKRGNKAVIFSFEGNPGKPPAGNWDIAFSLGGDGTVLYTARSLAPLGVPILPVNFGTLGFIAEVERNDWLNVFEKWERGELSLSQRCMLEVSVVRSTSSEPEWAKLPGIENNSQTIMKSVCLNDAVISAAGIAKLINLDVFINSTNNAERIALGSFRCDGLIISTPTGSTAYSMAAGGPILDPEMEAMILNPICPFTLSNRPFVLPSRQTLEIVVSQGQHSRPKGSLVLLTVDGQDTFELEHTDRVIIQQAPYSTLLIFAGKHSYYSALRNKLFWSPQNAAPGETNA